MPTENDVADVARRAMDASRPWGATHVSVSYWPGFEYTPAWHVQAVIPANRGVVGTGGTLDAALADMIARLPHRARQWSEAEIAATLGLAA